ncbi:hypothetical protein AKJ09_05537 [Labilithrix luteola]|uniref:Lipoprotein n=1 Tax=Labilithrix luteola TaxID=1391654 RepID=A0A0K1PZB9_9BACT|nr:hypothetical protein [Labilithrix luteola]AKU98873.1 hypothetical protein AKJ09_05537 [Labilithrix luteola]
MPARLLLAGATVSLLACAHDDPRRFKLAAPVLRDQDLDFVSVPCRPDPSKKDPNRIACAPKDYESSFAWDGADNTIFRPVSKFFQVTPGGEAVNVNAFDEVPDSSWFENRIGARDIDPEEAARGYCPAGTELTDDPPDGSWYVDHGKDNGANPGFRVVVKGTKFMLKTDDIQVERATAATAIASRLYYAAGWWAPCDAVVYFKRTALKLAPGLTVKANVGPARPFDEEALTAVLARTGRRGELYRATASRWLPGRTLGPFTYAGVRDDDPSDVIPHEDRRDLRGARVIAAWLNHFDAREQNTMSTWMPENPDNPKSQGYVRHWYIDLGDCFGSEWDIDAFSRRLGHTFVLDFGHISEDFITLGAKKRPWETSQRTPGAEIFGYFNSYDFDPHAWKSEYPNPAFGRMTEHDAAWAARIIARFTPEHVAAAVRVGNFTNPAHTEWLTKVLIERQRLILRRYFSKLSPITDVSVEGKSICAVDLARRTGVLPADSFKYSGMVSRVGNAPSPIPVTPEANGRVCFPLPSMIPNEGPPDGGPERYVVVKIKNGTGSGALVLHLYDLGPTRGMRLAGIERE